MRFVMCAPEGFDPHEETWQAAIDAGVSTLEVIRDPAQAVDGADILYTDVWASMGQEDEAAERAKIFGPYQVNDDLLSKAADGAKVMHCLPAHRGAEITDSVMDGPHAIVYDEAENRMHIQNAIMVQLMGDR